MASFVQIFSGYVFPGRNILRESIPIKCILRESIPIKFILRECISIKCILRKSISIKCTSGEKPLAGVISGIL